MKEQKNINEINNKNDKDVSLLEMLLDKQNREHIKLVNEFGNVIQFEQVAIIPKDKRLFCILHPVQKLPDVADDEAIVFECVDKDTIVSVVDNELSKEIFEEYYKLLAEV